MVRSSHRAERPPDDADTGRRLDAPDRPRTQTSPRALKASRPPPDSYVVSTLERADEIRIVLADDHPLILEGIRALIENAPGMEIVGEATNGEEAVMLISDRRP